MISIRNHGGRYSGKLKGPTVKALAELYDYDGTSSFTLKNLARNRDNWIVRYSVGGTTKTIRFKDGYATDIFSTHSSGMFASKDSDHVISYSTSSGVVNAYVHDPITMSLRTTQNSISHNTNYGLFNGFVHEDYLYLAFMYINTATKTMLIKKLRIDAAAGTLTEEASVQQAPFTETTSTSYNDDVHEFEIGTNGNIFYLFRGTPSTLIEFSPVTLAEVSRKSFDVDSSIGGDIQYRTSIHMSETYDSLVVANRNYLYRYENGIQTHSLLITQATIEGILSTFPTSATSTVSVNGILALLKGRIYFSVTHSYGSSTYPRHTFYLSVDARTLTGVRLELPNGAGGGSGSKRPTTVNLTRQTWIQYGGGINSENFYANEIIL